MSWYPCTNPLNDRETSYGHVFIAFWYTRNSLQLNGSMVKLYHETQIHYCNLFGIATYQFTSKSKFCTNNTAILNVYGRDAGFRQNTKRSVSFQNLKVFHSTPCGLVPCPGYPGTRVPGYPDPTYRPTNHPTRVGIPTRDTPIGYPGPTLRPTQALRLGSVVPRYSGTRVLPIVLRIIRPG